MNDNFANPQPPSNYTLPRGHEDTSHLTNDDFRKLLMTPSASSINREKVSQTTKVELNSSKKKFANEAAERRKEKKLYYASLMKEVKEREAELAEKYRDRAKERRENIKTGVEPDFVSTTQNFRSVAPDFSLAENADRRRQIIEESKFLGGDLEHTHLVKGLDYALLQKIKAELEKKQEDLDIEDEAASGKDKNKELDDKDTDDEEDDEDVDISKPSLKPKIVTKSSNAAIASALTKSMQDGTGLKKQLDAVKHPNKAFQKPVKTVAEAQDQEMDDDETKIVFKTKLARNIYRVQFETQPLKVNDLFGPNRMAYVVDLNDEESDVPITCMRSKADCPNNESNSSVTTNDIVINKLTQILSYLRHGKRDKKNKKKPTKNEEVFDAGTKTSKAVDASNDLSIYDDIGDYVPTLSKSDANRKKESEEDKKRNYFGSSKEEELDTSQGPSAEAANEFIKNVNEKYSKKEIEPKKDEKKTNGMSVKFDTDSYSECYPGTKAEEDVNIDSDEEVDFTKMDLGNKKGPVNRWDFDKEEDYNSYMSNREALPKAAFQFGVKMTDGRKTRRLPGDEKKNDKVKLDKEWTQISKLIDKRKQGGGGGSSDYKKPKY